MTAAPARASSRTTTDPALRAASRAVFAVFVLNGFNFSSWAARLPAVRDGLGLTPSRIGVLLLIGSIGSLLALPLSGLLVTRLGAPRTVLGFAILNASGLTVASVGVATGQVVVVGIGLVMYGVGTGVWDAAMNLEGAIVEQHLGRTVMPRYHAGFSVGTAAAAGVAALAAWLRVPVVVHLPVVVVLTTLGVVWAVRQFLPTPTGHGAPSHEGEPTLHAPSEGRLRRAFGAWFEGRTLLIGLVVLAAALTEGSANDWVALAVVDGFGTDNAVGALTFGLFVTAMTAMRFLGTGLLDRYGRVVVLRLCSGLALAGLLLFALVSEDMMGLALVGVVLWGMGAALGFPVGMSAASDDPLRAAARVSVVSTIGYSAFLAGPPLLGMLAQHVGYRHALLAIAIPVVIGLGVIRAAAPVRANLTQ
ncbi:MFS transporter [Cellulomonas sp. WB94]|uniref:MFS transporter n=1 Tax=Cellulomonas sp. WB94 TaxID=2173174 RepID=UPI000D566B8D|nr:MFS transporter [Cellulomonas sp. WB94]PVU82441.1 MFS transporter [Cellulomonas sp. WB94]